MNKAAPNANAKSQLGQRGGDGAGMASVSPLLGTRELLEERGHRPVGPAALSAAFVPMGTSARQEEESSTLPVPRAKVLQAWLPQLLLLCLSAGSPGLFPS